MLLWSDHVVLGDHRSGLRVAPAALQIDGQRITSVTPCDRKGWHALQAASNQTGIELGGRLITPAFVNAHAHLPMAIFRAVGNQQAARDNIVEDLFFEIESLLTPADIRAFARMGAYESLGSGVAVVWEHYYGGASLVEGLIDAGIAAFVAPTLQDLDGPGVRLLDAQLQATVDLVNDQRAAQSGIMAALGPHATDTVSESLWRQVTELALRHDLTIHAHLAQSVEELERAHSRHALSPAAWLADLGVLEARGLWVHGVFLSKDDLRLFDPSRHTLGFCPFSQLQFAFPADVMGWERAEMPWVVATDCGACNDGMGPQKELRYVAGLPTSWAASSELRSNFERSGSVEHARALQHAKVSAFDELGHWRDPEHLLGRVWSIPGQMDPKMPSGVIRPGAFAHLLTWDLSHPCMWPAHDLLRAVAYGETSTALDGVMVGGAWWASPGELASRLKSADYLDARDEADQRLARLLARLG